MMRAVTNPNDPRVKSPEQTLDMTRQFGAGTQRETNDTGAGIVEREMQVEVTSPSIRHAQGSTPGEEVNKGSISARRTDVHVRSGNMDWSTGFDTRAAPEQTARVGTRDFLPGMGGSLSGFAGVPPWAWMVGGAAAVYLMFLRK